MSRCVLAIVIVSFNTRDFLARCLASIERNPPDFAYEVVVVDNASTDGSVSLVRERFPRVRLLLNAANVGFGPACNQGIRAVEADFILLLNSDTEVLAGTLTVPVRAMQARPRIGLAAPEFVAGDGRVIQMSWGWTPLFWGEILQRFFSPHAVQTRRSRQRCVERLQKRERHVDALCGAALFARRETLAALNGMDEEFVLYFEDSDLCLRARKLGWDLLFLPQARIIHHLGKSSTAQPGKLALIYRQSQVRFYRLHGSWLDRGLLGLYLRLKYWRLHALLLLRMDGESRRFYEGLRIVLRGETAARLTSGSEK